ncbi:MAG: hypothetical protein ACHQNV_10940, partial [Vicinamibacteria bacterium]
ASPAAREHGERRLFLKTMSAFLRKETPADAVVLVATDLDSGDVCPALSWYGDRLTVELNAYTLSTLTARSLSRPLFILKLFAAPESESAEPSMRVKSPPDGFVPFAAWQQAGTRAVLLRRTH